MHPARPYIRDHPSREAAGGHEPEEPQLSSPLPDAATAARPPQPQHKMLFSDLYKSPRSPLSKLRNSLPHPIPVLPPGLDDDLVSRDKVKQKEAVKRFLADRVRNDWHFSWPPQQSRSDGSQAASLHPKTTPSQPAPSDPNSYFSTPADNVTLEVVNAAVNPASTPDTAPITATATQEKDSAPQGRDDEANADSDSDAESVYSTVSEDTVHFRPRAEWTSDLSDSDAPAPPTSRPLLSPFRFDSPDAVGAAVRSVTQARRARRRREVRDESGWNAGLACYNARRDAWTGARTVRVRPRAAATAATTTTTSPTSATVASPTSPTRRGLFWRSHSRTGSSTSSATAAQPPTATTTTTTTTTPLSPTETRASTTPSTSSDLDQPSPAPCNRQTTSSTTSTAPPAAPYPVETLLPLPPPLLPAQNPMRASITPGIYPSLYDKVVVHSLQPSCPINLADMVASCVAGWKRDGEWPPRPSLPAGAATLASAAGGVVVVRQAQQQGQKQKQKKAKTMPTTTTTKAGAEGRGHARKASSANNAAPGTPGTARRMSFGFLGGARERRSDELAAKTAAQLDAAARDESSGSAGRGIRRSLQKVFLGLGHGSHQGQAGHVAGAGGGEEGAGGGGEGEQQQQQQQQQ